jgi:hypothetical protein
MRTSNILRSTLVALFAAVAASSAGSAHADEEFDVSVSGTKVVVVAKGGWHINKEYPWKLVMGDKKLDKNQFTLSETKATVDAPKGTGKLKGGVCSGDQCRMFQTSVTIK